MMGVMKPKPGSKTRLNSFRGRFVLVGAGKMGGAMLDGWLARGLDPACITVLDPQPSKRAIALVKRGIKLNAPRPARADVIVVAVKPQDAASVMTAL
jgi:pyrroline-5-carboxylate reductase